jgi:hypothetical protein
MDLNEKHFSNFRLFSNQLIKVCYVFKDFEFYYQILYQVLTLLSLMG